VIFLAYRLGVLGIGHWFERLYEGIKKTDEIQLVNVAGVSSVDDKRERLTRLGVPESNYFQLKPSMPMPERFFDNVDIVHISDPNEFHAQQTLQTLYMGKIALTEKTFGVNRDEFEEVLNYIESNAIETRAYLHLHYADKLLTLELPKLLERLTKDCGKVVSTSATFFELENPKFDRRRVWIFEMKNGGIFMDWVHPFEVYYKGALARRFHLLDMTPYIINSGYSDSDPTGVHAIVEIEGEHFKRGAIADIRVGMGLRSSSLRKRMRFFFENASYLDLNFINSEEEYVSEDRGSWELFDRHGKIIESGHPKGPTSSDIFMNDILELCRGRHPGFSTDDLRIIFEQQWRYQEMLKSKRLVRDEKKIESFVNEGMENKAGAQKG